jgi:hypothetical protein
VGSEAVHVSASFTFRIFKKTTNYLTNAEGEIERKRLEQEDIPKITRI